MAPVIPDGLSLRTHATKGRALHASKSFQPGQVIAVFQPTLLLPSSGSLSEICAYCFKRGKPRSCKQCRVAFYCDAKCQTAHWTTVHKAECAPLSKSVSSVAQRRQMPTPIRALFQVLMTQGVDGGELAHLEGHVAEKRDQPGWADWELMAMAACAFAGLGAEGDVVNKATELLCKINTNAFHRYDADIGEHGVFLEPTLAMVNHSCVPNAFVQFIGRRAVLRAESAIAAGDEIEISYTDNTAPLHKRMENLAQYTFECQCPRCKDDLNIYQTCQLSPSASLNKTWFPDWDAKLRSNKTLSGDDETLRASRTAQGMALIICESVEPATDLASKEKTLKEQYAACKDLAALDLWALSPLATLLTEISILYSEKQDFAYALFVACFSACEGDAFRFPAPFHPSRVKNLFVIVKLLSNTAPMAAEQSAALKAKTAGEHSTREKLLEKLLEIDQVSLCQMLLVTILKSVPDKSLMDWDLAMEAMDMLQEIENLPGREQEMSLIRLWQESPSEDESQAFFQYAVIKQLDTLSQLGRQVLAEEFEKS